MQPDSCTRNPSLATAPARATYLDGATLGCAPECWPRLLPHVRPQPSHPHQLQPRLRGCAALALPARQRRSPARTSSSPYRHLTSELRATPWSSLCQTHQERTRHRASARKSTLYNRWSRRRPLCWSKGRRQPHQLSTPPFLPAVPRQRRGQLRRPRRGAGCSADGLGRGRRGRSW